MTPRPIQKILRINRCHACTFFNWYEIALSNDPRAMAYCNIARRQFPFEINRIPDFCPLENAPTEDTP